MDTSRKAFVDLRCQLIPANHNTLYGLTSPKQANMANKGCDVTVVPLLMYRVTIVDRQLLLRFSLSDRNFVCSRLRTTEILSSVIRSSCCRRWWINNDNMFGGKWFEVWFLFCFPWVLMMQEEAPTAVNSLRGACCSLFSHRCQQSVNTSARTHTHTLLQVCRSVWGSSAAESSHCAENHRNHGAHGGDVWTDRDREQQAARRTFVLMFQC